MAGKSTRELRLRGIPAAIAVFVGTLALVGVSLIVGRFFPERSAPGLDTMTGSQVQPLLPARSKSAPSPIADSASAQETNTPQDSPQNLPRQGLLRVGNLTDHPIRVALLLKRAKTKSTVAGDENYEPPAHWDFEPGEGSDKGLLLSLPSRSLKLKPGDILVAFAQDGSRRYWGPYVVGETPVPAWSAKTAEWQLVLQP